MVSPPSLWDDDCWFASQAEMCGHCARLSRHVKLRGAEQSLTREINDVLDASGLPGEETIKIWRMTSRTAYGEGTFFLHEVLCAMALAARRRKGMTLPEVLPHDIDAAARDFALSSDAVDSALLGTSLFLTPAATEVRAEEEGVAGNCSSEEEEEEDEDNSPTWSEYANVERNYVEVLPVHPLRGMRLGGGVTRGGTSTVLRYGCGTNPGTPKVASAM